MPDVTCPTCGGDVPPKRATGPRATYCSPRCRQRAGHLRNRDRQLARVRAKTVAARAARAAMKKICAQCGSSFTPQKTRAQKFCSKLCMKRAHRYSGAACSAETCERPAIAKGLCSGHYNRTYLPNRSHAGDPDVRRRLLRTKTQRRRAAMTDPNAENVDRDLVGERDGWRCGICRRKVDNSLPYPLPRSPSLDHVVPLSEGGEHTYANCRISHLSCNLKRSNKGGGEQLALIG